MSSDDSDLEAAPSRADGYQSLSTDFVSIFSASVNTNRANTFLGRL